MSIWVLSDPHLAFSVPQKTMEVFGPSWKDYAIRIAENWKDCVKAEDLVLIPGDISWAMRLEEAMVDLLWLDALPGTKVLLRGNHDYWWSSSSKLKKALPPSMHFIQNNALLWNGVAIGGSRLWDTPEYQFGQFVEKRENPLENKEQKFQPEEDEKIFLRELERLNLSLSQLDKTASYRIAMTHYPPIGPDLTPSRASAILESFGINTCVFGHLHNIRPGSLPFGEARGVSYIFSSCDYLNFTPKRILL